MVGHCSGIKYRKIVCDKKSYTKKLKYCLFIFKLVHFQWTLVNSLIIFTQYQQLFKEYFTFLFHRSHIIQFSIMMNEVEHKLLFWIILGQPDFVIVSPKKYKSSNISRQECKKSGLFSYRGSSLLFYPSFCASPNAIRIILDYQAFTSMS